MGEVIEVEGSITVTVAHNLLAVPGTGPSLFGRDWLQYIKLDWSRLQHLNDNNDWQEVMERHADMFKDELGVLKGVGAKLHVDPQVKPQFY